MGTPSCQTGVWLHRQRGRQQETAGLQRAAMAWAVGKHYCVLNLDPTITMARSMDGYKDAESSKEHSYLPQEDSEHDALLPHEQPNDPVQDTRISYRPGPQCRFRIFVGLSFLCGIVSCLVVQGIYCAVRNDPSPMGVQSCSSHSAAGARAPPYVGSSEVHNFPPTKPTNAFPSLFPTNVGYAGPTPTGAEPAVIATAPTYPIHTGPPHLVPPSSGPSKNTSSTFDVFKHWGNLSPWFSVERGGFGLDSGPGAPETCRITGLHLLHRHGARYPAGYGMESP